MAVDSTSEAAAVNDNQPRNFLATFLLATSFGVLGLRHFYLGDKKLGWIRLGLFLGGYLLMFLMAAMQQFSLMFLGLLAVSIAAVWALIDFFYVYFAVKTDAGGHVLTATNNDKRWAGIIFWTIIALFALSLLTLVLGMSFAENTFKNNVDINNTSQPTDAEIRTLLENYQQQ